MTKKRKQPTLEETLDRPWCFYCERDFDDQKVLASHQKAKHFRCKNCNRRLNTIGGRLLSRSPQLCAANEFTIGLAVHLSQVHKENLDAVEDALPNRNNIQLEIFGMEGVPQDIIDQHRQRIIREYTELHGHRQSTNNQGAANASKKPKIETKEEIKARLAAFKAKKAAGELPGSAANGSETPTQVEVEKPTLVVPYDHGPGGPQSPAPFVWYCAQPSQLILTVLHSKVGFPDSHIPPPQDTSKCISLAPNSSLQVSSLPDTSLLTNPMDRDIMARLCSRNRSRNKICI